MTESRDVRMGQKGGGRVAQVRGFVYPTGDNRRGGTQGRESPEDCDGARDRNSEALVCIAWEGECAVQWGLVGDAGLAWDREAGGSRGLGLLDYGGTMRCSGIVTVLGLQVDGAWVMLQAMIKGLCCHADVATKAM